METITLETRVAKDNHSHEWVCPEVIEDSVFLRVCLNSIKYHMCTCLVAKLWHRILQLGLFSRAYGARIISLVNKTDLYWHWGIDLTQHHHTHFLRQTALLELASLWVGLYAFLAAKTFYQKTKTMMFTRRRVCSEIETSNLRLMICSWTRNIIWYLQVGDTIANVIMTNSSWNVIVILIKRFTCVVREHSV